MKDLRHASLYKNVFYMYVRFYVLEISVMEDIFVQKIKVKKSIFQFLTICQTSYKSYNCRLFWNLCQCELQKKCRVGIFFTHCQTVVFPFYSK